MPKPNHLQDTVIAECVNDIELAMGRFITAKRRKDYPAMMFQLGIIMGSTRNIYDRNEELEVDDG